MTSIERNLNKLLVIRSSLDKHAGRCFNKKKKSTEIECCISNFVNNAYTNYLFLLGLIRSHCNCYHFFFWNGRH